MWVVSSGNEQYYVRISCYITIRITEKVIAHNQH